MWTLHVVSDLDAEIRHSTSGISALYKQVNLWIHKSVKYGPKWGPKMIMEQKARRRM